jgi:DNA-binding CsgD family transcriptional regulator
MLELCIPAVPVARPVRPGDLRSPTQAIGQALGYRGPERRHGPALLGRLMALMLDEVDYGLLLLGDGHRVMHVNHAAQACLAAAHPLVLAGHELRARLPKDAMALHQALQAAAGRGLRRLLTLGEGGQRAGVAIVPLGTEPAEGMPATLLLLGRREVCGGLSVHGYAREHRLSPSEEQVLSALCEGCSPNAIALRNGVKIATVRTQIANIRAKTGAESIRDLVQQVAVLPPLVGALRHHAGALGGHWQAAVG